MAVLNSRNLPQHVHQALRVRAATAGRSMEAEARDTLTRACASDESPNALIETLALPDWVDELFGADKPTDVVDSLITERRREAARE
jgi:plasmid stability protein